MGKYLAPPNVKNVKMRCALVFWPEDEGVFFLNAIRGQLSALGKWWLWDAPRPLAEEVAQLWMKADLLTSDVFFKVDCEDVPFIIGEEDLNINITNSCGCCDSSGATNNLYCVGEDGNTYPAPTDLPIAPMPPGGAWPVDRGYPPPGDVHETWEAFDVEACGIANGIWRMLVWLVVALETATDTVSAVAAALVILVAVLPTGLAAAIGVVTLTETLLALLEILTFEQATDWLNDVKAWLEANQEEVVCLIFEYRDDLPGMRMEFVRRTWLVLYEDAGLDGDEEFALKQFLFSLMSLEFLFKMMFGAAYEALPETLIDCSLCPDGSGNENVQWAVTNFSTESAFTIVSQSPTSFRASGWVAPSGVSDRALSGVGLDGINGHDIWVGAVCHGVEFRVVTDVIACEQVFWKVRGEAVPCDLTAGMRVLVHDGTLDGSGFDRVEVIAPLNGTWWPASYGTESSETLVSTGGQMGSGDSYADFNLADVYFLDASGERYV